MAFGTKTNERPGTRAQVRWARVSAYKAREVLDLIRGQSYGRASEILEFTDRGVADVIRKCLDSAVANAEHNDSIAAEELYVSACFADEGPTLKRFRPRARGRASRVRKCTCHITVIVTRYTPVELAELRSRDAASGRPGGRTSSAAADARRRRVARSRELAASRAAEEEAAHDHDHDHDDHDHDHDHDTDAGTETDAADATDHDVAVTSDDAPYGPGSAAPLEDGGGPEGYDIKGNADSMLYHVPDSRYYKATKAEVYFATVEDAERAGFAAPGSGDTEDEEESE
jgi:large subunit ribosomal protein L22